MHQNVCKKPGAVTSFFLLKKTADIPVVPLKKRGERVKRGKKSLHIYISCL